MNTMAGDDKRPASFANLGPLIEALARSSFADQGSAGAEARARMLELRTRVEGIARAMQLKVEDTEARTQAAVELDKLVDTLRRLHSETGRWIAKSSPQIQAAFRGVDLETIAEGLKSMAGWLRAPTPETTAIVMRLVDNLRALTGQSTALELAQAEAKRKADIEADVKASIDEIFRPTKKP